MSEEDGFHPFSSTLALGGRYADDRFFYTRRDEKLYSEQKSLIGRLQRCRRQVAHPLISIRWVVLYLKLAWSGIDQVIEKGVARSYHVTLTHPYSHDHLHLVCGVFFSIVSELCARTIDMSS